MTRIVCKQLAPRVGELGPNCELSVSAVKEGVAAGADVVVLPELVTSGYVFESPEEAAALALPADHEVFDFWGAAAGPNRVVVGGFCEEGEDGHLYNSCAVVTGGSVASVYRKAHLWDREKLVFEPGNEKPPIVDTPLGKIGVLICYDLEFPEMTRMLALGGAELIAVPTNWPLAERPAGERPPEIVIAMAAARINRIFIACADRIGTERGQEWTSGTAIIDSAGWVLAMPGESDTAVADVDLARARAKALTELSDALADRRPDLYGELAAQGPVHAGS
jgi:5-aminopentanamidase